MARISPEQGPDMTTRGILQFTRNNLGRGLSRKESTGLKRLISEHGPETIHGFIMDEVASVREMKEGGDVGDYLETYPLSQHDNLSEWIQAQIKADPTMREDWGDR